MTFGAGALQVAYNAAGGRDDAALRETLRAAAAAAAQRAGEGAGRLWGGGRKERRQGREAVGEEGCRRSQRRGAAMGAEVGVNGGGVGAGGREGWVQCDNLGCRRWARPPPSFWAKAGKGKAGGVAETGATAGAETGDGEERAAKEEDWA